ncbi:M56 family metallopeptidase [Anatilimnocola floriformis]|uniref:M56 family metallopeptidase n=1 Tax=Anatilimnocola floriformis TaxID=2948575 RepID=UPI0020C2BCFE|nr:M56 family metallopeptidase [Anatilimnocola floriformis]
MDGMFDQFVRIAWMQCWQVTLLVVLVGGLVWCFGRSRPNLASVLWLLVIVKCVTPPVWSSPSGIFCWLQPFTKVAVVEDSPVDSTLIATPRDADDIVIRLRTHAATQESPITPNPTLQPHAAEVPAASINWSRTLATSLVLAWFAGLLACSMWMFRRWQACWRQIRTGQVEPSAELSELLSDLQQRLKIRRKARLLITSSAVGPAVVGLWRPTIVLPNAVVEQKQIRDIELLLAHELVHIRRGDLWIAMLQLVVQCLWWFHPLVRWANQWLTRETERSCDEEVIGHLGCTPLAYARSLLNLLELKQQLQPVPAFPGVRPVDVTKQRLERIMQLGQGCRRNTPWWCWAVMAVLALITLPGAALLVRAKDPRAKGSATPATTLAITTAVIGEELADLDSPAELITATYDVQDLITAIQKDIVDDSEQAVRYLQDLLQSALSGNLTKKNELSFGWHNGQFVVRTTAAGQRIVAEHLDIYRQSGFAQYVFEVRLLQAPARLQQAVQAEWQAIQPKPDADLGRFEIAMDGEGAEGLQSTMNRQQPVIAATFDEQQMRTFMTAAQADKEMSFVCAPKVTTFNGQAVRIESLERRPFVVAVKEVEKGTFQPEIRVVDAGWKMRLRARGLANGKIKVDFARAESQISQVDIGELPGNVNVQIPQVAVNRLQTQIELSPEHTYAIGGLKSLHESDKNAHLWLLITVRKIDEAELREESSTTKKETAVRKFGELQNQGVQPEKVTKLYSVADLSVEETLARLSSQKPQFELAVRVRTHAHGLLEVQKAKTPELGSDKLIELITSTIEPDSWSEVGGEGTVEFAPQQGSLLVTNYEWVHQKIADLLGQLRLARATTVVLNLRQVWIPTAEWQKMAADAQHKQNIVAIDQWQGFQEFNAEQTVALLKHDTRKLCAATKAITYNGQLVAVEATAGEDGKVAANQLRTLHLVPVIGERNCVRINIAPQTNPGIDAKLPSLTGAVYVNGTQTLFLDLDRTDWQCADSKLVTPNMLQGAGEGSASKGEHRHLLMVTAEVFRSEDGVAKRAKGF